MAGSATRTLIEKSSGMAAAVVAVVAAAAVEPAMAAVAAVVEAASAVSASVLTLTTGMACSSPDSARLAWRVNVVPTAACWVFNTLVAMESPEKMLSRRGEEADADDEAVARRSGMTCRWKDIIVMRCVVMVRLFSFVDE